MANKYVIEDWAGNHLFKDKTFPSFEDGWEFLYEQFPNGHDEEHFFDDYYVVPKTKKHN